MMGIDQQNEVVLIEVGTISISSLSFAACSIPCNGQKSRGLSAGAGM
jgi:hypothetical protein